MQGHKAVGDPNKMFSSKPLLAPLAPYNLGTFSMHIPTRHHGQSARSGCAREERMRDGGEK